MKTTRTIPEKKQPPLNPKKILAIGAVVMAAAVPLAFWIADGMTNKPVVAAVRDKGCPVMPEPGKQVALEDGCSFTCEFAGKPKLGINVLKIQAFDQSGRKDTSLEITGEADMPSMTRAHSSGPQRFAISNKGDYLLPVNAVMAGGWEVLVSVSRNGKVLYRGRYPFNV